MSEKLVTFYVVGPTDGGDGAYFLCNEQGEWLFNHWCSNASFALRDLIRNRKERQERLRAEFGEYTVAPGLYVMQDGHIVRADERIEQLYGLAGGAEVLGDA